MKRAVIFIAWGKCLKEVQRCIYHSSALEQYDLILITDKETASADIPQEISTTVFADFNCAGHARKATILKWLPNGYDSYLLLDSDTIVMRDISYGFEKAEQFGIALALAPVYDLTSIQNFNHALEQEIGKGKGQPHYNSGVVFFILTEPVKAVFNEWHRLVMKHKARRDQRFLSIAIEKLGFNPWVLSPSFNLRGKGKLLSGALRIWHKRYMPPENINDVMKLRRV